MAALDEIYDDAREKLNERLTQYRLLHSISVAEIAELMAQVYEVDPEHARIAGLLHDWDKNYSDEELVERAHSFGIPISKDLQNMPSLLHAQTGAYAVAKEYPELPKEIIQAINRHTSAAKNMSDLDMIIYVADMIEPLRSAPSLRPLRALAGNVPLVDLFTECYKASLEHLVRRKRYIHPDTIKVWNAYVAKVRDRKQQKG